jgi:outer membrane protein TolC
MMTTAPSSNTDLQRNGAATAPATADLKKPLLLQNNIVQNVFAKPLTLVDAVQYAEQNYPAILKSQAEKQAAKLNVTVQKLNEYLPDSLFQIQDIMASHNKLSEIFFGSPVFPAASGPGVNTVNMAPYFSSGAGFSIDWAPLDFGLHKARINLSKSQYGQASAQSEVTKFDVSVAVASAYLDVVESLEEVRAAEENVASFTQFHIIVDAQVNSSLKPAADSSLAEAQLANTTNQLLRARLARDVAIANLANTIGIGGKDITVDVTGIASESEPAIFQKETPIFEDVPILRSSKAALNSTLAQRKILDKEYYPVFHFLGGVQTRGSGLALDGKSRQSQGGAGVIPVIPNYQVALIVNWNFLDYFRLKAEKKVQDQRIVAQQQDYNLILQNLQAEDVRSRARIRTAIQLAANMPVQVHAATIALNQAEARYKTGLGSVAQVAEANQILAQSRMQEAVARVGVWRALLSVASVHGDLKPFLAEAQRIQKKGM